MKNRRALFLFGLALVFGIAAAVLVQRLLEEQRPELAPAKVATASVVVAKTDLALASQLASPMLTTVEWPAEFLPKGSFRNLEDVTGRVLRHPVAAGETIQEAVLLPEGSAAGLASVINEQWRAVSVKVDPIVGVAGFVTPGSRVDVLATLRRLDWTSKQPYAKVVLQNVKVLAIDQKLEEVGDGKPELVSVVTLEVEPDDAEKLTFVAHEGRLQLALRSPTDEEIVKTRGTTVSRLLGTAPTVSRTAVQVVKGTSVTSKSF
jgi:pilus assembly protein CpaB